MKENYVKQNHFIIEVNIRNCQTPILMNEITSDINNDIEYALNIIDR